MAAGSENGNVLAKALQEPENINELRYHLTIGDQTTWILDHAAYEVFKRY